jgi:uncharacterized protein (TIGR04255 family)
MKGIYMQTEYEVYPAAPLQLVAMELRYPFSPRLASPEALAFFHDRLSDVLPLAEPIAQQGLMMFVGPGQPPEPPRSTIQGPNLFRLSSRGRSTAVTVSGGNTILETSNYERYGKFRPLVEQILGVLAEFGHPVGIERVGLRYIDEIRVPGVADADGWEPYIHQALIGSREVGEGAFEGLRAETWQGQVQYTREDNMRVNMTYGALNGVAVAREGLLRLARADAPGPFFLMDVDSYWQGDDYVDEFSSDAMLELVDTLHRPIRAIFEASITDALRDEVLRRERNE